ncbi:hypothetical protein BW143_21515 [Bacillus swezeyi]|uniref:Uncharacterized protein n=1 Tax=Bacillus swezeyi TaxID=1925020 RepID=A0A1R1Q7H8_9BACI|nr:hypothetical protein BW143_21515 [Bacillus swezeyi]
MADMVDSYVFRSYSFRHFCRIKNDFRSNKEKSVCQIFYAAAQFLQYIYKNKQVCYNKLFKEIKYLY